MELNFKRNFFLLNIFSSVIVLVNHGAFNLTEKSDCNGLTLSTALLDDERRSNHQQTEESTKQIQYLQS